MKSSRLILVFAALSIIIHGLIFLVKISPSEKLPATEPDHLIPVELAFLPPRAEQPPEPQTEEEAIVPTPPVPEQPSDMVQPEPVPEKPEPAPVKDLQTETSPEPESAPRVSEHQPSEPSATTQTAVAESSDAPRAVQENPIDDLMRLVDLNTGRSYPLRARKRGQEGTVLVSLILDKDGNMLNVEIIGKSRYSALNTAALELVEKIMETPYPHGLGKTVNFKFPVTFRLSSN